MHEFRGITSAEGQLKPSQSKNLGLVMAPLNMVNLLSSWSFSNTSISKILPQEVHLTNLSSSSCLVHYLITELSEKQEARCVFSVFIFNYIQGATINIWMLPLVPITSDNSQWAVQPVVYYSRLPYSTF